VLTAWPSGLRRSNPSASRFEAHIGVNDLHIAGRARSEGLTLVTHHTREFERVLGLQIADWTFGQR
jgi:predicted nucleic acid-binding protein